MSKQDKGRRFYSLYDNVWREDVLWEAWQQVTAHHGAPGVEGTTSTARVAQGQEEERSQRLQKLLRAHRSQFAPVRRVEMPQPQGGTRPFGSATGDDRVVQTAMKLVLEPVCAADVHDCSSGYRPTREAKDASIASREEVYKRAWGVVESDFHAYVERIPHDKLRTRIRLRLADGSMVQLITQALTGGGSSGGQSTPTNVGVPQGSPLSPFYRNLSRNLLEQLWHKRGSPDKWGATLHRYADDASLGCRPSASPARDAFTARAQRMGLTRNRDKTRLTKLTAGCDFLGLHLVKRQSPTSGKQAIYIFPAKTSQQPIRNRLQYLTSRRAPITPQACVEVAKHTVTGGVNSSRHTNASEAWRGLQRLMNLRFRRD